jgi:PhzF family phenazine biosynthesis protein
MIETKLYQVDAFADEVFKGNPAAVCLLDEWLENEILQKIAMENNLSETAYLVQNEDGYDIRWFTPRAEVALCGHATLASAYVLFERLGFKNEIVKFSSRESGILKVVKNGSYYTLDFPRDEPEPVQIDPALEDAMGVRFKNQYSGKTDALIILESQKALKELQPDFRKLLKFQQRGFIVTAPGDQCDFVSRFFCPALGIDEDPVTGSAHTTLAPYWSGKTGKLKFEARQLSERGGALKVELSGERVLISGQAVLYLEGKIKF